ncbi:TetR/AcrR family transcriptional regulator [Fredinandcohnia humi]
MPPIVSDEYKQKKKREILDSAQQAFGEKGYQVATIDDIVAYSGMSKGAIYNYFESKEDIYVQLMNLRTERTFEFFEESLKEYKTATEKIKFLFKTYADVELNEDRQKSIQVHVEFFINSGRDAEMKKLMVDRFKDIYQKFLIEIVEEGKKVGEFGTHVDSNIISSLFWGILDGVCLHYSVLGADEYPYQDIMVEAEKIFMQYIQK